jgi:hypothetical protein
MRAIRQYCERSGIRVDQTADSLWFTRANLSLCDAVVFLNTSGDVLGPEGEAAFRNYVENGGGFVGVHGATDTEYDWAWYGRLIGTYFKNHPKIQPARLYVINKTHPSTSHLPAEWERIDEWYNFRTPLDSTITVLITLDETSYTGGENGGGHPFSWYHEVGEGRAWYTAGGHTEESYRDSLFLEHLFGGIRYAMGQTDI